MSYYNAKSQGMGWWLEDAQKQLQAELQAKCPPSTSYQTMVARADELERTWNPTGVYTWQDMSNVVGAVVQLAGQASSAAIRFFEGDSTPAAKASVRAAGDAYNAVAKRALDYTAAWREAKDAGKPVSAPGFKRWVIDDLRAAAALYREVEIAACTRPWWLGAAASYGRFFDNVIDVSKRVGGVIAKVAGGAIDAVEKTGDILAFLFKWGPYLALGVGGYVVWKKVK